MPPEVFDASGSTYIAQRFRDPRSNAVTVLYCLLGQWDVVREINY